MSWTASGVLTHLCVTSEHDNIELRVLPVEAGAFPGAGHAILNDSREALQNLMRDIKAGKADHLL
ncbi:hypothetical protein ACFYXH_03250 [Streptomyces sp. NPDC002730]|uniref:hypothetical protein n=1 Tax=Streptomyces sp. NPDC002730 TaxID=3364662 RepID=UPI0036A5ADB0